MANFETHLAVAAVANGLLSTACLGAGIATPKDVVLFWALGTAGGILPDIDSDHSTAIKLIFTVFALIIAWLSMLNWVESYSILELWIICGVSYLLVRYLFSGIFTRFTVHRGIFHSISAAFFFWFSITALGYQIFHLNALKSWSIGFFVFFGFLVHLCLDEMYSVDLMNTRIKRSFGTALKIVDTKNLKNSTLMILAILGALYFTPNPEKFTRILKDSETYNTLKSRFMPENEWFKNIDSFNDPGQHIKK